jgi:hypothetical protein
MRGRLGAAMGFGALSAAGLLVLSATGVGAAPPPGGVVGSGAEATGELLGGGGGARVGAGSTEFAPGAAEGGGGGDDGITCSLVIDDAVADGAGQEQLQQEYDDQRAQGVDQVYVSYVCSDEAGNVWYTEAPWAPADPFIDPELLMQMALETLYFPAPSGASAPSADVGMVTQLDGYFWIDNWAPVSETATAGPVSATVTATPVQQTWTIDDSIRGATEFSCDGPGVAYDPASGGTPPEGACVWRPPHSSAGQASRHPTTGQPCFPATVTITWGVAWTAQGAPGGGQLDPGTSSSSTCLVIDEIQAVVTDVP